MKWKPHIHTIVTEGAIGSLNIFYDALRNVFKKFF